jgi:hypothetical protein
MGFCCIPKDLFKKLGPGFYKGIHIVTTNQDILLCEFIYASFYNLREFLDEREGGREREKERGPVYLCQIWKAFHQ